MYMHVYTLWIFRYYVENVWGLSREGVGRAVTIECVFVIILVKKEGTFL